METEQNLVTILTKLPEDIKYRTIFRILASSTTEEEAEKGKRSIPHDTLMEALNNLPENEHEHHSFDEVYIKYVGFEAQSRRDIPLLRECAQRLEEISNEFSCSDDYKLAGFWLRDVAKSDEGTKEDAISGAEILFEAQEWKEAGELYEFFEMWSDASVAYERASDSRQIQNYHSAVEMAEKSGNIDRAISIALKESGTLATRVAAEAGRYEIALEHAETTHHKGGIAETCGKFKEAIAFYEEVESYKHMAKLAIKHGLKDAARRAYLGLIGKEKKHGWSRYDRFEKYALAGELWEELAKLQLENKHEDRNFQDAYIAVISGTHVEKKEVLQSAMEESVRNLQFRSAALFAHYLGEQDQAERYRTIGLLIES